MSEVLLLKEQLHQVALEAKQAAGGLAGFTLTFAQHSAQVQALIAGTATGADRDIALVLEAATKAVEAAVEALESAAFGCATYADQI